MTYGLTHEEEQAVQKERSAARLDFETKRDAAEVKGILRTYGGRAFFHRLLSECGVYRAPATHPQGTFREVGHRDIGLWVTKEMFTADKGSYTLMIQEAEVREEAIRQEEEENK